MLENSSSTPETEQEELIAVSHERYEGNFQEALAACCQFSLSPKPSNRRHLPLAFWSSVAAGWAG